MTYDGTLVMPRNCVAMTEDEMTYVEGGYIATSYGTAKQLKNHAAGLMTGWFALTGGFSLAAAALVASGVGVVAGVIAGIGAGYCAFAGNEYRKAFNYFSAKSQTSSTRYKMSTTSFIGFITGVSYGLA
ncbi:MAG: hypothetical protein LBL86_06910 [Coriobacteriales bacterium]|jgi:hypothetical protein|nr:hypothetical protein [Coriobacteriales bacterium]